MPFQCSYELRIDASFCPMMCTFRRNTIPIPNPRIQVRMRTWLPHLESGIKRYVYIIVCMYRWLCAGQISLDDKRESDWDGDSPFIETPGRQLVRVSSYSEPKVVDFISEAVKSPCLPHSHASGRGGAEAQNLELPGVASGISHTMKKEKG